MAIDDLPFDPAHYAAPEAQAGLIGDALASGDAMFVAAALRTVLRARHLTVDVLLPEDPRLSVVLATLDRLGIDLHAALRKTD